MQFKPVDQGYKFLRESNLPYGELIEDGVENIPVVMIREGLGLIDLRVNAGLMSQDDLDNIGEEMVRHGVLLSFEDIVDHIKAIEMPEELLGDWDFITYKSEKNNNVGYILFNDQHFGDGYLCLWYLFNELLLGVEEEVYSTEEATLIFQKAARDGLPIWDMSPGIDERISDIIQQMVEDMGPNAVLLSATVTYHK